MFLCKEESTELLQKEGDLRWPGGEWWSCEVVQKELLDRGGENGSFLQPVLSLLKDSGSAPPAVLLSPVLGCSLPLTHSKWLCILTLAAGQAVILMDKTKGAQKGPKIHILQPGEDLPPGKLVGVWRRQNL